MLTYGMGGSQCSGNPVDLRWAFKAQKIKFFKNDCKWDIKMTEDKIIDDFSIIVGDSSEVFLFESPDIGTFDPNWVAHMAITESLGEPPIVIKELQRNDDIIENGEITVPANSYFVAQITPTDSSMLEADVKYYFVIQVKNDILGYKHEIVQCRLKAKEQGIFR